MQEAAAALRRSLAADLPELRAEDLRLAWRSLGRITGRANVEDLLDVIFADFCLGNRPSLGGGCAPARGALHCLKAQGEHRWGGHHETQHRSDPDHPCRQPAAARRSAGHDPGRSSAASRSTKRRFAARVKSAVAETVRRQAEAGIDIVADGEMGRIGFIPYVNERLTGIEPSRGAEPANYWTQSREYLAFPEFYAWAAQMPGAAGQTGRTRWVCTGPISYKGMAALQRDIANLKAALAGVRHEEAFMPAVSPSNLANWNSNEYYKTEEEYLYRARRRAARGIPGDRRCRPRVADR